MTKTKLLIAAIAILIAGCSPVFSPISGNQVDFDQLMKEWTQFQNDAKKAQACYAKEINHTNDITQAAKNDLQSSPLTFLLQFLDDPSNSGIGVTLATAFFAALIAALHLNNQRLNRKIALPEVDDDDADDEEPDDSAKQKSPPATSMADLAAMGAFGAVAT